MDDSHLFRQLVRVAGADQRQQFGIDLDAIQLLGDSCVDLRTHEANASRRRNPVVRRATALIDTIAEALLVRFGTDTLLDKYDVYQRLMTYWADVMQDDVTLLVVEGWQSAAWLREIVKPPKKKKGEGDDQKKEGEKKEKPDLVVGKKEYKAEVIPVELVIRRYFAPEQATIDDLTAHIDAVTAEIDQLDEEPTGRM